MTGNASRNAVAAWHIGWIEHFGGYFRVSSAPQASMRIAAAGPVRHCRHLVSFPSVEGPADAALRRLFMVSSGKTSQFSNRIRANAMARDSPADPGGCVMPEPSSVAAENGERLASAGHGGQLLLHAIRIVCGLRVGDAEREGGSRDPVGGVARR